MALAAKSTPAELQYATRSRGFMTAAAQGPLNMPRSVRRSFPAFVLALIITAPGSFLAHSSATHALTCAALTSGTGISGLARDASGGAWFAGQTCSAALPTTAGAV